MTSDDQYHLLRCPACTWCEECGHDGVLRWLRSARKVRPGREPEPEILYEVFRGTAGQLTCPQCGQRGLVIQALDDRDGDWPGAPLCDGCRQPIPRERWQALPGVRLCAACQQQEETGRGADAADYCPRCGALMELRLSRSAGLARYVMTCTGNPPCRT